MIAPERKSSIDAGSLVCGFPFLSIVREAERSPFPPITLFKPKDSSSFSKLSFNTFKLILYTASTCDLSAVASPSPFAPKTAMVRDEGDDSLLGFTGLLTLAIVRLPFRTSLQSMSPVNTMSFMILPEGFATEESSHGQSDFLQLGLFTRLPVKVDEGPRVRGSSWYIPLTAFTAALRLSIPKSFCRTFMQSSFL